jgi:hypothetical protein
MLKKQFFYSIFISLIVAGQLCITSIGFAQSEVWTTKKAMPTARTFLGACVIDGKIYAIGGATSTSTSTSAVEMYDPITDTWVTKASMPAALCYPNVCVFNGKIYVFGGSATMWSGLSNVVYVYDPDNNTWSQNADSSHHDYLDPVVAVVDSQIYLIGGGKDAYTAPVQYVDSYMPLTDTWTIKAEMPTARYMFTSCVFNGKVYCIGGSTEDWYHVFYKTVEVYDPYTNTWSSAPDMPVGRWCPAACEIGSLIYVIGGFNGQNACDRVDILNPITNVWTQGAPIQHIRHGLAACVLDKKIYIIGGSYLNNGAPTFLNSLEVFDAGLTDFKEKANDNHLYDFHLSQNYPNPFNPTTNFKFRIPASTAGGANRGFVSLKVFDLFGREIATIVNDERPAGTYEVKWNAINLSSGVYFYQLRAGIYVDTKKMILLR